MSKFLKTFGIIFEVLSGIIFGFMIFGFSIIQFVSFGWIFWIISFIIGFFAVVFCVVCFFILKAKENIERGSKKDLIYKLSKIRKVVK